MADEFDVVSLATEPTLAETFGTLNLKRVEVSKERAGISDKKAWKVRLCWYRNCFCSHKSKKTGSTDGDCGQRRASVVRKVGKRRCGHSSARDEW